MANVSEEKVSSLLGDDKIGKYPRNILGWYEITYKICAGVLQGIYCFADMIAATSVLQIRASEVRSSQINWQSYLQ